MTDTISFDLVSPERLLLSEQVEMVTVPGRDGDFGVLAGHAPVIATLRPGVIGVKGGPGGDERYFVLGGFAEVTPAKLTILAEDVRALRDIDIAELDQKIRDAEEDILQAASEATRSHAVENLDHLKLLRAACQTHA